MIIWYSSVSPNYEKNGICLDISPIEFQDLIRRLRKEYKGLPIIITENVASFPDELTEGGEIKDLDINDYIKNNLQAITTMGKELAKKRRLIMLAI